MTDCILVRPDKRQDRADSKVRREARPPGSEDPDEEGTGAARANGSWEANFKKVSATSDQVTIKIHATGFLYAGEVAGELEDHTFEVTFKAECTGGAESDDKCAPHISQIGEAVGGGGTARYHVAALRQTKASGCVTLHLYAAACFATDAEAAQITLPDGLSPADGGGATVPFDFPPNEASWQVALGTATWCCRHDEPEDLLALRPIEPTAPGPSLPLAPTEAPGPTAPAAPAPPARPVPLPPVSDAPPTLPAMASPTLPDPGPTTPPGGVAAPKLRRVLFATGISDGLFTVRLHGTGPGVTSLCDLEVVNHTPEDYEVLVPGGTQFVPTDPRRQVMVCTADAHLAVTSSLDASFTTRITTLCASPFGYEPPPRNGSIDYLVPHPLSPVMTILDAVQGLRDDLAPTAESMGMPWPMFEQTIGQYATWAAFTDPHDAVPSRSGSSFGVATIADIVTAQLAGRGVPSDRVQDIAMSFWDAVDKTLDAVDDASPATMDEVVEAGLQHVRNMP